MTTIPQLRTLLAGATPGPWEYDLDESFDDDRGEVSTPTIHGASKHSSSPMKLFDMLGNEDICIVEESDGDEYGTWIVAHDGQALANAALIVALRNNAEALLDEIEAARVLREALEPFAAMGRLLEKRARITFGRDVPDDEILCESSGEVGRGVLTMGHFRDAMALLPNAPGWGGKYKRLRAALNSAVGGEG